MERDRIEAELRSFIGETLLDGALETGVDPLAADAVDSLGLEQLVEHIEKKFSVMISSEEMVRANFGSLPALASLIESRASSG